MRELFLACVVCAAGAQSAFALKKASSSEVREIQAQIYLANKMDSAIREAEGRLVVAKNSPFNAGKVIELDKALAREINKQSAARTKAMHMTILAYGLEPVGWSGTSVMPWTKGRTIHWQPVAREREARQIQNADGKFRDVKQGGDYAGITYIDGVTYMDPSAFEKGPGFLASYLLHERVHFEQFTTAGKGDAMTYAEAQKEAYQAQVDSASYFFDPNIPADLRMMQDIERLRDEEQATVALEVDARKGLKGILRRFRSPSGPPDVFESKVHTNEELADISGLVSQARGQSEIARRETEQREARARAAAEQVAHDEGLKRTYAEMAVRSCANPGSVTQDELDDLPVSFQKDLQWSGGLPPGLDECAVQVYFILRKGLDASRLRERSMPVVPFAVLPDAPRVAAARPSPPATPAAQPKIPLNSIFPTLKDVAVRACASPARAVFGVSVPQAASAYSFNRDRDDESAAVFSDGLGECSRGLFYKLIDTIRSGQASAFSDAWLRDMAKRSSAAGYVAPSPQSSLPVGCIPGDSSRRNCIACGNTNCG